MKKTYHLLLIIAFILTLSIPVQASENFLPQITSGYTDDGIYYEVYGQTSVQSRSDSISVARQVVYEGRVNPEKQIFWQETIDGVAYTGTLKLAQIIYGKNKTIAVYEGILIVKK